MECYGSLLNRCTFTALSVLPNYFRQQGTTPPDNPNGVIVDNPIDTADDDTTPATSEIHVSMDNIPSMRWGH